MRCKSPVGSGAKLNKGTGTSPTLTNTVCIEESIPLMKVTIGRAERQGDRRLRCEPGDLLLPLE